MSRNTNRECYSENSHPQENHFASISNIRLAFIFTSVVPVRPVNGITKMFSLPGNGRHFSDNVGAFPRILPRASRVSCIWNKREPKASLRREMACSFPPFSHPFFLFPFFSGQYEKWHFRGQEEQREPTRPPPSLRSIKPSSRLSTSGGRWPSSTGTYCSLTTRWYSKGIGLGRGYPRGFDPTNSSDAITTAIVTPYRARKLLPSYDFDPVTETWRS